MFQNFIFNNIYKKLTEKDLLAAYDALGFELESWRRQTGTIETYPYMLQYLTVSEVLYHTGHKIAQDWKPISQFLD